ncbi:beta-catenin-interacting protein 1 isoform X1 [Cavia porcellus]|uniref:beta-catenin-interacting protein 1 isoform X1 n=1 Tax=Cavia porcellus TaxID=10141 RepID=UPI002FE40D1E
MGHLLSPSDSLRSWVTNPREEPVAQGWRQLPVQPPWAPGLWTQGGSLLFLPGAARAPQWVPACLEFTSEQESPEPGQGDEPRGRVREESGRGVHPAEGPRATHAEEDGLQPDGQRGGVPAHLCRRGQQPAQPAAPARHRPGCGGRGDGLLQVRDGGPQTVAAVSPSGRPGSCEGQSRWAAPESDHHRPSSLPLPAPPPTWPRSGADTPGDTSVVRLQLA